MARNGRVSGSGAAERLLPAVLRVVGAVFTVFFTIGLISSATRTEAPGFIEPLFQWDRLGNAEEQMLSVVYVVWGVFMWIAARDPLRHRMFLDFTLAGNAAHFLTMLVQGIAIEGEHLHLVGDVPLYGVIVAALAATWLPLRRRTAEA